MALIFSETVSLRGKGTLIDPRLPEALEQAAETLALDAKRQMGPIQTKEARNLVGWAEAVRLLDCWHQELYEQENDGASLGYPGLMHEGVCSSTTQCDPCKPCRARGSFIKAMLGE